MMGNLTKWTIFVCFLVQYSSAYKEFTVEDDDLCSLIKKRKLRLGKESNSGLIVRQTQLNNHFDQWGINFRCKFQIAPSNSREGIIAVIQHIIFRKNATNDECIDYVQFTKKDGSSSQKFCGRFNAALHMDHNFVDPSERISSGNSFVDERGEMDVVIFVSKEPLKYDEEIDLSIVFTAYRHCSEVFKKDISYRPCSLTRREFCIYSGFFSDMFINCPLPDCKDEQGCSKTEVVEGGKYGNKVLIGALSAVSVMFIVFILSLWICKTYKIFCWSHNFANSTPTTREPATPRVIEMNEQGESRASESQGNNATSNNPVEEDKDLPPSYDSLFPRQHWIVTNQESKSRVED